MTNPMGESQPSDNGFDKRGLLAALISPILLGCAPIFGKLAYQGGSDPFTVAALRTVVAAAILWVFYLLFWRRYIYIYPAGLLGCIVVGVVNGIGSLFYYNGLNYLSASVAQLLNATYLIFVVVLTRLGGQRLNARTVVRTVLAMIALTLLTGGLGGQSTWLGAGLMIANAMLFAGTLILGYRVLYEMPSQTFTLYVVTTMAIVVVMARAVYRLNWVPQSTDAVVAIGALSLTTAASRLLLFVGIKKLGTLQTVLLGIFETLVAVVAAHVLLHESLSSIQWIGAAILMGSLLLVRRNDLTATRLPRTFSMASVTFTVNQIAFMHAFGDTLGSDVTPDDLEAIKKMMTAPPRFDVVEPDSNNPKPT
ncbi:MAG TPA: DMT family transporter [Aggregatilineales bacterium]|nr:DMT family transporter [Aggregatilineales bacterium]